MEIKRIFKPRSVAVVGASRKIDKPGYQILKNFLTDFKGRIYPVNPNADRIAGIKSYPNISSIPYQIDLAIIAVKEDHIPAVLRNAIKKKVKLAIIISEITSENVREEVLKTVSKREIRILGPSSIGLYIPRHGLNTLFIPKNKQRYPASGGVGIASQSGAVGSILLDELAIRNIGVSSFIGLGKEWDITLDEVMEYFYEDTNTFILAAYLESIANGRKLFEIIRRFSVRKPLIIYKGGRDNISRRVVETHTGTMVDYRVFYGAARQSGAIIIKDLSWMVDTIQALYFQPLPKGNRIGIVTGAGGLAISLIDKAATYGMEIREYVDVGGTSGDDTYLDEVEKLFKRDDIDVIALIPYYPSPAITEEFNIKLYGLMKDMRDSGETKPIYVISIGSNYSMEFINTASQYKIPVFTSTSSFVDVVGELYGYWRYLTHRDMEKNYREVFTKLK